MEEVWTQARYLTAKGEVLLCTDYEVSNYGKVRNKKTGRFVAIRHCINDYCSVRLSICGKKKNCRLHRLVLSSFTDNKDGSLDVNHKDENKDNNCLTNLEWLSHTENLNYGSRNERAGKALINGKCSKPVLQYDKNGNFIREWPSIMEVQRQLNFANCNICSCCNGKYKSSGGFVWRYKK